MDVSIKFLGAAKTVTGSKYLLNLDNHKILIDCGLFQGLKELRLRNWDKIPVDINTIDTILITHGHIDHIGYLPRLVRDGFKGKIYCTTATADLMKIMLKDAARLQEEEALYAFQKGYSKHTKPEPLFTTEDAERVLEMVIAKPMEIVFPLCSTATAKFINTGHILGSSCIELTVSGKHQSKTIVFSGDIGRYDDPVMYPPTPVTQADILIVESTYGNRLNPMSQIEYDLKTVINEAIHWGGMIVIPAFALGRTQSLIYYFNKLMSNNDIPTIPIYIDSPMAINVTNLYEKHHQLHKIKVEKDDQELNSIFDTPNLHYCNTAESSKALNNIRKPGIIISASGMCTGGRILHHMVHRLPNHADTFLFTGFQAEGTRGRNILEGQPTVKIFGESVKINCHVRVINGLSAHADQNELMRWLKNLKANPKMVFVTHGEPEISDFFASKIRKDYGWTTLVPEYLESFMLFEKI